MGIKRDHELGRNTIGQLTLPENPQVTRQSELASLLQRMQGVVDKALKHLEDEATHIGPREVGSIANLAKVLPLLQQAEMIRHTRVGNKQLKDMSSAELKRLAGRVLKGAEMAEDSEAALDEIADE